MKNRIAILTDTNSGLSPEQAKAHGIDMVPMPVVINDETFFEHQSIDQNEFFNRLRQGASVRTSQPMPSMLMEIWDRLLEKNDHIIYLPMSSGLSGSYETACSMAQEYSGRVYPVDNHRISVTLRQSVLEAKYYADLGMRTEEIVQELEKDGLNASIYLAVNTLEYLKRGGRVWTNIFPHLSLTKKPAETRQGKGKGTPEKWVAVVKEGKIMFEVAGVSEEVAREALRLAMHKLPIKCKFVKKESGEA